MSAVENLKKVEIHLYGKLRRYADTPDTLTDYTIRISLKPGDTIASVLARVGIPTADIYSIFFNRKLLAARSAMVHWLGYRQACSNPLDWNLNVPVKSGDRIGLFGRDMAALVI